MRDTDLDTDQAKNHEPVKLPRSRQLGPYRIATHVYSLQNHQTAEQMSLDHNEFLQLSRIADFTRRSDPELVRRLAAPMGPRRRLWATRASYVTLAVCALLSLVGLVTGNTTTTVVGGLALLTIYPLLLIVAKERPHHRTTGPEGK